MNFKVWKRNKEIQYVEADEKFKNFMREIAKEYFLKILADSLSHYKKDNKSYCNEIYLGSVHTELVNYFRTVERDIIEKTEFKSIEYIDKYLDSKINTESFIDRVVERINQKQIIK